MRVLKLSGLGGFIRFLLVLFTDVCDVIVFSNRCVGRQQCPTDGSFLVREKSFDFLLS